MAGAAGDGGEAGGPQGAGPSGIASAPGEAKEPVKVDESSGVWRTGRDPGTGRFAFISPAGEPTVLRGVSMTGMETGTRGTASGAGFWLFNSAAGDEASNAPRIIENVVDVLVEEWSSDVVRIPICGSAWTQNYVVKDYGEVEIGSYHDWVDVAVRRARSAGKVVILDLHLWSIAKVSSGSDTPRGSFMRNGQSFSYADYEDGCTGGNNVDGIDSCAPEDWFTQDATSWQCAISNADGITLHNAHANREHIRDMWVDVARRYKDDSAVFFELFNEPYTRKSGGPYPAVGPDEDEPDYPWELWSEVMALWIEGIRDGAEASNIIIVNGMDWGYSFGPDYGPIAKPDQYLPWKSRYTNVAYGFHPYQHGSCCGSIGGDDGDQSIDDPYQSAYCAYYPNGEVWGEASGSPLPGGASCVNAGYAATQDKKMPPCHWVSQAHNPMTGEAGLCAGDRTTCSGLGKAECEQVDWGSFGAGGWSRYVLPMAQFGPLIATEFGSFDCSSPYVTTLLRYMREFDLSYTAWALWPQNSGGPGGLGACGYPSVMASTGDGDFRACLDRERCAAQMQPLPYAGQAVFQDLNTP